MSALLEPRHCPLYIRWHSLSPRWPGLSLAFSLRRHFIFWVIPSASNPAQAVGENKSKVICIHLSLGTKVILGNCSFLRQLVYSQWLVTASQSLNGDLPFYWEELPGRLRISLPHCRADKGVVILNHAQRRDILSSTWAYTGNKTSRVPSYCYFYPMFFLFLNEDKEALPCCIMNSHGGLKVLLRWKWWGWGEWGDQGLEWRDKWKGIQKLLENLGLVEHKAGCQGDSKIVLALLLGIHRHTSEVLGVWF